MAKAPAPLCNHVKANGTVCHSPALKDEAFCFFHAAAHDRIKRQRRAARHNLPFQLPLLEDAESVQLAIGDTLNALVAGRIDHKTAGLILYGLQTAASNVRHTRFRIHPSSRAYDYYHNQEEEMIEGEVQEEIAAEADAASRPANNETVPATTPSCHPEESVSSTPGPAVSDTRPAQNQADPATTLSCHPEESVSSTSGPVVSDKRPAHGDSSLPPKKSAATSSASDDARKKA